MAARFSQLLRAYPIIAIHCLFKIKFHWIVYILNDDPS